MTSARARFLFAMGFLATTATLAPASGQGLDVAIVAAASLNGVTDCRMTDPQARLLSTGLFDSVDLIDTVVATPTLAELLAYDAVLSWTNVAPADNETWGEVMADYVDAGGGVVTALFANTSTDPSRSLGGRWRVGYEVILPLTDGSVTGSSGLGDHDSEHPIFAGVTTFDGGTSSFRPLGFAVAPGTEIVARWIDTRILVATLPTRPGRVDLGLYPPSSDCFPGFQDPTTDGAWLMANALVYVSDPPSDTEFVRGDCSDDGSIDLADVIFLLGILFPLAGPPSAPACTDACDTNDDATIDLSDAIALLGSLFGSVTNPLPPPNVCGPDPSARDPLHCDGALSCP